mmetsp:Transcript_43488/g.114619  ORF Transcript_43488/g.114619 Transcript_43488/m.114619 type:complete len:216 (-) Transcript_43488:1342-1989(-)
MTADLGSTSQIFAWQSKRFASCTAWVLSPTHSRGMTTRNPCCMPSSAVARMQPEVEQPTKSTVSMRRALKYESSGVPKNAPGCFLIITSSPCTGSTSGQMCVKGLSSVQEMSLGTFFKKISSLSKPSSPYTTRVKTTGTPLARHLASSSTVCATAETTPHLGSPQYHGDPARVYARQKSTTSSAGERPKPIAPSKGVPFPAAAVGLLDSKPHKFW